MRRTSYPPEPRRSSCAPTIIQHLPTDISAHAPRRRRRSLIVLWIGFVFNRVGRLCRRIATLLGYLFAGTAAAVVVALGVHAYLAHEHLLAGEGAERVETASSRDISPPSAARSPAVARPLRPAVVRASSEMQRYPVRNAFDGNPRTTWSEGREGPGRGEWIELDVSGASRLRSVSLSAGFDSTHPQEGDLFYLNAHLKRVSLWIDGHRIAMRSVQDDQREVVFEDLDAPLRPEGSTLRLVADDVYEGTRWQDLSITEVRIEAE